LLDARPEYLALTSALCCCGAKNPGSCETGRKFAAFLATLASGCPQDVRGAGMMPDVENARLSGQTPKHPTPAISEESRTFGQNLLSTLIKAGLV